jgi:outer membrane protein assembly factor BamB
MIVIAVLIAGGFVVLHDRLSPQRPAKAADERTTSAGAKPWHRTDLKPVSQPVPAGGRVVVYTAAGGRLHVLGLDARSGRTVWSREATPSVIAPGVPVTPAVVGTLTFYIQPGSGYVANLVGADAATGRVVWRSEDGLFTSWPSVCPSDAGALCLSGRLRGVPPGTLLRFDAGTGRVLPGPVISATDGRLVGPDLYDTGQRQPEILVSTSGADIAWRRPLADIFSLAGASTDWGWTFQRLSTSGVFVGSPGAPPVRRSSTRMTINLAHAMTAGFRINNGDVVWRDSGSFYMCDLLRCPGTGPTPGSATDRGPSLGVRLRAHGLLKVRLGGAEDLSLSRGARGVLEGFDPATGRTTWRFDAGRNVGLLTQTGLPALTGRSQVLLSDAAGHPVMLDLATGHTTKPDSHTDAWCRADTNYRLRSRPYGAVGKSPHKYVGEDARYRCDARGHRSADPTDPSADLAQALPTAAGHRVWSGPNGVFAVSAT